MKYPDQDCYAADGEPRFLTADSRYGIVYVVTCIFVTWKIIQ